MESNTHYMGNYENELMEGLPPPAYVIEKLGKILNAKIEKNDGCNASLLIPPGKAEGYSYSATRLDIYIKGRIIDLSRPIPEEIKKGVEGMKEIAKMGYVFRIHH